MAIKSPTDLETQMAFDGIPTRPVLYSADELIRQDTHRQVAALDAYMAANPVKHLSEADEQRRVGIQLAASIKTRREQGARRLARKQRRGW